MYNKFATNLYERGVLYIKFIIQQKNIIDRFYCYFSLYFEMCSFPTIESLFLLVLSMLALKSVDAIYFLYTHLFSNMTEKSLHAFCFSYSTSGDANTFYNEKSFANALRLFIIFYS